MKRINTTIMLPLLLSLLGTKVYAADIAVENADGVTIYYNYRDNGLELEVTRSYTEKYSGNVVIPAEVTYMERTRKVTAIGLSAFNGCRDLSAVTIPESIIYIGGNAFMDCTGLASLSIPEGVKSIGLSAFSGCTGLTSINIPNSVTSIASRAFEGCSSLTSVSIGKGVTSIGESAFYCCDALNSVHISDLTSWLNIDFQLTLTSNPLYTAHHLYLNGEEIKDLIIPENVTTIGNYAFYGCSGLTSMTMGNSVTGIGVNAFSGCSGLTSITIGKNVKYIGEQSFTDSNLTTVISLIEEPFVINGGWGVFSQNTLYNATLYVPNGTLDKYKTTNGWNSFLFIEESGEKPETPTCEKPTISYKNSKLTYTSATEGAICVSTITNPDIGTFITNEMPLSVTYHISVYATKDGYNNSETATATLCWIEVEPRTEGIDNTSAASVRAQAVLIQSCGSSLTISGAEEGTPVSIYDTQGRMAGSVKASAGTTTINTTLRSGDIGIVKIGEKVVKYLLR